MKLNTKIFFKVFLLSFLLQSSICFLLKTQFSLIKQQDPSSSSEGAGSSGPAPASNVGGNGASFDENKDQSQNPANGFSDIKTQEFFSQKPFKQCPNTSSENGKMSQKSQEGKVITFSHVIPFKKKSEVENSKFGFGPSAYFFDYLDGAIRDVILQDFQEIWNSAKSIVLVPESEYKDKYSIETIPNAKDKAEYNKDIYGISLSTSQIYSAAKQWNWNLKSLTSYSDAPVGVVGIYDYDGDGRLNPKEFLEMVIDLGYNDSGCTHCLSEIRNVILKKMFDEADVCGEGMVKAEGIWKKYRHLQRKDSQYNIYECLIKHRGNIRTEAVNDFIIKMRESNDGKLNRKEFTLGILYGYLNRQVNSLKITLGDEINGKNARWNNNGIDEICNRIISHYDKMPLL